MTEPVAAPTPAPAAVRAPEPVPEILRTAEDLRARIRSLADRGELAAAERECIAALEIFPMDAELTCLQATLFLAAGGDGREAAAAARRAIYLDRAFVLAHLTLAHALSRLEDRVGAGRALRNAVRLLAALPADQVVPREVLIGHPQAHHGLAAFRQEGRALRIGELPIEVVVPQFRVAAGGDMARLDLLGCREGVVRLPRFEQRGNHVAVDFPAL